uniref:Phospholipid/glycerol acyltransferase domain-containing protein n=1 Tax=Aegilops tauschii subsp. strangulata TaxID=200361 RepID=A0A453SLP2_AEGTS
MVHFRMCFQRKAAGNSFPRVLLFPEGTTTNGRFLISFQHGAFIPGYPVQPVVVRYPHVHFDQSWGNISLIALMFKMFTQFHNFMEVEYLPIVYPPEIKQENALHFAENTSYAMAHALNVLPTSYSYADSMIASRAEEAGKGQLLKLYGGNGLGKRSVWCKHSRSNGTLGALFGYESRQ